MKTKILKFSTIVLLFAFISAGCQKDDILELQIGDENAVIQHEVDGIEFEFCLLNEQGEPATVFNEDENFTFQFSFRNLLNDSITVTTEFINDDFFRVYQVTENKKIDKGKPWTGIWCDFSLSPHEIIVTHNNSGRIQFPWVFNKHFYYFHPLCTSVKLDYLAIGKYITGFDLNFHYQVNGETFKTNNLEFKINFEIK